MDKQTSEKLNVEGATHFAQGEVGLAMKCFDQALELYPLNIQAMYNLGLCNTKLENFKKAEMLFMRAVQINHNFLECYLNLAGIYYNQKKYNKALVYYKLGETKLKDYPNNYTNIGDIYLKQRLPDHAEKVYKTAISYLPSNPGLYNDLGVALSRQSKYEQAIAAYKKCIQLDPKHSNAFFNIGILYAKLDDYPKALEYYEKCLKIDSNYEEAIAHYTTRLPYVCDWKTHTKWSKKLDNLTEKQLLQGKKTAEQPFMHVTRSSDKQRSLEIAKNHSKQAKEKIKFLKNRATFNFKKLPNKRVHVGYMTDGFRNFPTGHNITRVLELHDKENFKIHAFSYGEDDGSEWRKRAQKATAFFDIKNITSMDAAATIYNQNIDILVDLKGYTGNNWIDVMALKPAPIIVSLLGFVGTTGSSFHDYIIADKTVIPKEEKKYYSEKILHMPDTYWPTDNTAKVSKEKKLRSRKYHNLPEDAFVFASFNNCYKITEDIFASWMKILKQVDNSVVWTIKQNQLQTENLKSYAKSAGVNPSRIIFSPNIKKPKHLARITCADLALDTRLVNGHTTTVDCLYMGLPVVTIKGKHFASRVSASILSAINMPELITKNHNQYEQLAIKIATNKNYYKKVKTRLVKSKKSTVLFNTEKYVSNLEKLYSKIYRHRSKNLIT